MLALLCTISIHGISTPLSRAYTRLPIRPVYIREQHVIQTGRKIIPLSLSLTLFVRPFTEKEWGKKRKKNRKIGGGLQFFLSGGFSFSLNGSMPTYVQGREQGERGMIFCTDFDSNVKVTQKGLNYFYVIVICCPLSQMCKTIEKHFFLILQQLPSYSMDRCK